MQLRSFGGSCRRPTSTGPAAFDATVAAPTVRTTIQAPLIAEGIEQPEELDSLLALGVGMGQGFLLGKPQVRCARTVH